MTLEGGLSIDLYPDAGRVRRVVIRSTRPFQAQQVLRGKSAETALSLLPLMYNVCAQAQALAGLQACRRALGRTAAPWVVQAQQLLVDLESVREHLWRMVVDWPPMLGEPLSPHAALLSRLIKQVRRALFADASPFVLNTELNLDAGALRHQLQAVQSFIEVEILAAPMDLWLAQTTTVEDLSNWTRQQGSVAARLLYKVAENHWTALGNVTSRYLPPLDEGELYRRFHASDVLDFIAMPSWENACYETTTLARQCRVSLLMDLAARHGNGLLTRLAAKIVELVGLMQSVRRAGEKLIRAEVDAVDQSVSQMDGEGIGQVEAARGRLVHWVKLVDGRIEDYRILAPTEWNFHPEGVAAAGLKSLVFEDETMLRLQARCWLDAIDPCVAYEVRLH